MHLIVANDRVRLEESLPELELDAGEVGQVVSAWFYPNTAYEVEFSSSEMPCGRRVLLLHDQIVKL